jgi:hypothetical protein
LVLLTLAESPPANLNAGDVAPALNFPNLSFPIATKVVAWPAVFADDRVPENGSWSKADGRGKADPGFDRRFWRHDPLRFIICVASSSPLIELIADFIRDCIA